MSKLIIRSGPQAGMEFPLDKPVIRLGRGSGSDIILQSTQSSRQHSEISQQGSQLFIRDLGSTNGTFVNNQPVTTPRPLQPGDQIRIGDVVLSFELGPVGAPQGMATDWEAELWSGDQVGGGGQAAKPKKLIWILGGVAAVMLIAIGVAAVLVLRGDSTPTPVAAVESPVPTQVIVVAPTATEPQAAGQPTVTPLVEVDVPTVEVAAPTVAVVPTIAAKATTSPVKPPSPPQGVPSSPQELEKLPPAVQEYLGNVPQDQLPQAIAQQIQTLGPEQVQEMIGSLFPGVDPAQLPAVVAASFPGLPQAQLEAMLGQVFPGQNIQIPKSGPVGGRIALGIYDEDTRTQGLFLVNAMGGEPKLLASEGHEPNFSPDGQWLVYHSGRPDALGLRLIKLDGSGDTLLTSSDKHGYPSFSPDGQRVAFHDRSQDTMYVINRDGSGQRGIGQGQYPDWSPAGDQIVYRGCIGGGKCGLIVANADGSNPRQVTSHANDAAPRWSPNGGQIAFHSDRDGNWEVYVINSDGSWLRRITMNPTSDVLPVWSPDGLRIAFRSDRGGQGGVWLTSGIGGAATKLLDAHLCGNCMDEVGQMDWAK